MINRRTFLLIFCVIVSGCTIHLKNGETITWPAPATGNQIASTTYSYHPVTQQSYHYPNPTPQYPPNVAYARPATTTVEPSEITIPPPASVPAAPQFQNPPQQPLFVQQQTPVQVVDTAYAQSGNHSDSHKDPLNSLMSSDHDRMEAALDRIAQEYRRVAGDKARLLVGFSNIPNNSDYIRVTRHDLPVLAEPNFGAENLTILGLAQVGEYLPVLQEVESTYTLHNPLSNTPNNGGKWCQVRVSSGESGWVMVEPYGMGSTSFAQIVRRPQPQPAGNGNQDYGAVVGLIIVVGVIVLIVKLMRSSGGGGSSSTSGGEVTYSSDGYSSYDSDYGSDDSDLNDNKDNNDDDKKVIEESGPDNEICFSIRIEDEDGEPIKGLDVKVWYKHGAWGAIPAYADVAETDSDGWAQFEKTAPFRKMMDGGIEIDVKVKNTLLAEDIRVEDGDTFSYTMDRSDTF